jgi:transcriptional regulator with XRE-family HTH domain
MTASTTGFAHLLRMYRQRAGMSQEALSEASGVSARTISDLERGQRGSAHLETIRLLAQSLGLTSDQHRRLVELAHPATGVAAELGLFASAARMIGAVDEMLSMLGTDLMPFDKPGYARARDACGRALETDRFDTLVAAGRRLTPEEWLAESSTIVDYAKSHGTPDS